MNKSAYRPDIDGLRAAAVLAVLLYHAGIGCPGGFIGVDVFFVISGYLITSFITKNIQNGTFSLLDFWERRICRIFPAMAAVVFATIIAGWLLLLPEDPKKLGASIAAQSFSVSNIYFWHTTNYFGGANEDKPMLHTWSLAVEEQFYDSNHLTESGVLFAWKDILTPVFQGMRDGVTSGTDVLKM